MVADPLDSIHGSRSIRMDNRDTRILWETWLALRQVLTLSADCLVAGFAVLQWMRSKGFLSEGAAASISCGQCAVQNPVGQIRCTSCKYSLRPSLLAIVTTLGILFSVLLAVGVFFAPLILQKIIIIVPSLLGIWPLWAARNGHRWGLLVVQWTYGLNVIAVLLSAAKIGGYAWVGVAIAATITAFMIWYLNTKPVRAFCSLGGIPSTPAPPFTFKFSCPECGQHISVTLDAVGTVGACPSCGCQVTVPSSASGGL